MTSEPVEGLEVTAALTWSDGSTTFTGTVMTDELGAFEATTRFTDQRDTLCELLKPTYECVVEAPIMVRISVVQDGRVIDDVGVAARWVITDEAGRPDVVSGAVELPPVGIPAWFDETVYPCRYATSDVAIDDLDGDGDSDVVAAASFSGDLCVYLNDGEGELSRPNRYLAAKGRFRSRAVSLVTGDIDGDEDRDLVGLVLGEEDVEGGYVSSIGYVSVLLNNGNGAFAPRRVHAVDDEPLSFTMGDLDEDGYPDLIIVNSPWSTGSEPIPSIRVLMNDGAGGFSDTFTLTAGKAPYGVAMADLNHDQHLDVVVTNLYPNDLDLDNWDPDNAEREDYNGALTILPGNGDGTFAKAVHREITAILPWAVTAGDFNGDGTTDLATAGWGFWGFHSPVFEPGVSVLTGKGDGTFDAEAFHPTTWAAMDVVAGDFDSDEDIDLAVAQNLLALLVNNGDETFTMNSRAWDGAGRDSAVGNVGNSMSAFAVGDLDGDGDPDLVAANGESFDSSSTISVLLNRRAR